MKRLLLVLAFFGFSLPAFAAGGTCPTAPTYMEPVYGATSTSTLSSLGVTSCFFIDFTSGVDTNAGTDETHPWLHAPGMTGCSNTCSSTTPTAGEGFIFKGGTTWTLKQTAFMWTWAWSGSSSNPIYLGYDPAWFAGGSWTRPVISSGGVDASCPQVGGFFTCSQQFKTSGGVTYVDVDNFEFTGMYNTQPAAGPNDVCAMCPSTASGSNLHFYNNYMHGANVQHDGGHAAHFIYWGTSGNDNTSTVHHNVIDNRDGTIPPSATACSAKAATLSAAATCTMTGLEGGPRQIFLNYIGYMGGSLVVVDNPIDFHNNLLEWETLSPDNGTDHENMFESNGETGSGMVMYNNVVQHGWNAGVVDFQMGPNSQTSYAFNNVLPDMDGGNMEQMYEGNNNASNVTYWFNNSAEGGPEEAVVFNTNSNPPSANCGRSTGSLNTAHIINQHCITTKSGTTWWSTAGTNTFTTTLAQSLATATGQGYTNGNATPYALFPPSGGSTVGAGTNETSLCTTIGSGATTNSTVNAAAAAACGQDTSYGVNYDSVNHIIVGPGRPSTNARPGSGAWDIGAYEFATSQAVTPSCTPGSGTYTANQTVTCTNPNSGTTVMCYSTSTTPATNGSGTGCTTGTQYTTALTVSANETLNVIAGTSTLTDSAVVTYSYVLQGGAPVCSPVGGTYIGTQSVALSQPQSLAIGYTTNGTSPVSNGSGGCAGSCTLYSGAISVASSETIKSIGMASGWTDSSIASCAYVINAPAATDMTMKGVTTSQGVTIVQ